MNDLFALIIYTIVVQSSGDIEVEKKQGGVYSLRDCSIIEHTINGDRKDRWQKAVSSYYIAAACEKIKE